MRLYHIQTRLGIKGTALTRLRFYLADRTQEVLITDNAQLHPFSFWLTTSPYYALFSIYALPIADIVKSHDIEYHLYADDT